jgi:hypothetical protein
MRRILGFALLFILSSVTLMAAKNSQTFYLSSDVRAGSVQLPRGICEVTWSTPSGSRVQLTIKTDDKKTVTVPSPYGRGKGRQGRCGHFGREWRYAPGRTSHQECQIRLRKRDRSVEMSSVGTQQTPE